MDNRAGRADATIGLGARKAVINAGEMGHVNLPIWLRASCDAAIHLQLGGKDLIVLRQRADALDDAQTVQIDPDDAEALCVRGGIFVDRNDPRARMDQDRALSLDPGHALAYALRGKYFA